MSFLSGMVNKVVDKAADVAKDKVSEMLGIDKKEEEEKGGIGGLFSFGDDKDDKKEEKGGIGDFFSFGDDKDDKKEEKGGITDFLSFGDDKDDKKEEKKGGFAGLFSENQSPGSGGGELNLMGDLGDVADELSGGK